MGIKLIVEILDNAPADLTPAERLMLIVLAESANDTTRKGWPSLATIARRTGLAEESVSETLRRLARRHPELEVRVPIGVGKDGRTVYAAKGHQTTFHIPDFKAKAQPPLALNGSGGSHQRSGSDRVAMAKGPTTSRQRSHNQPVKAPPPLAPSPHEPSKKPSTGLRQARAAALARLMRFTEDEELANLTLDMLETKGVRRPDRYLAKIEDDGDAGIDNLLAEVEYERDEAAEAVEREEHAAFVASVEHMGPCEHGFTGGHTPDPSGWCRCPHERYRLAASGASFDAPEHGKTAPEVDPWAA